jgi:hypothetical protein
MFIKGFVNFALTFFTIAAIPSQRAMANDGNRLSAAFQEYERTGNRDALSSELIQADEQGTDLRSSVAVLLEVISSTRDERERDYAVWAFFWLARHHPFASSTPDEIEIFRPALSVFERHLNETSDEESLWAPLIAGLTWTMGFQPSVPALSLIYRRTNYRNPVRQALAFNALARVKPFPSQAIQLFRSRLDNPDNGLPTPMIVYSLQLALPDPNALKIALEAAESPDIKQQKAAIYILSVMDPMPPSAITLFRRLQRAGDLEAGLAEYLQRALDPEERKKGVPSPPK